MVPRPDYTSRVTLWRNMILQGKGRLTEALDISSLAKISDGYTAGQICTVAVKVLSEYRVQQVHAHTQNMLFGVLFLVVGCGLGLRVV